MNGSTQQRVLRVGIMPIIPYMLPCTNYVTCPKPGLGVEIIAFACDVLKLRCEYCERPSGAYGERLPNGTWIGAIGDIQNGVTDTYLPFLTPSLIRNEVVRFSQPFMHDPIVLMTRMPSQQQAVLTNVLWVFRPYIWVMFLLSMALVRITQRWLRRLQNQTDVSRRTGNKLGDISILCWACSLTAAGDINSADDNHRLTLAQRLAISTEWLIEMVVLSVISCVAVCHQLSAGDRFPFVDLKSFIDCLDGGDCRLVSSSNSSSFMVELTSAQTQTSRKLVKALGKYPLDVDGSAYVIKRVLERQDVYLTLAVAARRAHYIRWQYREEQQFHVVELDGSSHGAFALRHNDELMDELNAAANLFTRMGFDERIFRKYGQGQTLASDIERKQALRSPKTVQIKETKSVMLFLVIGWSTAAVVFLVENLLHDRSCS